MAEGKYFISDNASGVHPEVLALMTEANRGHAVAYGHDEYTERATTMLRQSFGERCEVFFALTGTGANVIALQSVLRSFEAVICADSAHLHRDECGAPEKFLGSKMLTAAAPEGKLHPTAIERLLQDTGMVHRAQPRVVTVSQCTEWGTVYQAEELRTLAEYCHDRGLLLHMDGARLGNAAVAQGLSLREASAECGVDILSFGGTKNGLMGAEAVLFFDPELAKNTGFFRKQAMQLSSKMRFVAAQFIALLSNDLWRRNAAHANAMAARLASSLGEAVEIVMPVESNVVFARLPPGMLRQLQATDVFAVWDSGQGIVRWMTSFDTTADEVDAFSSRIHSASRSTR